MVLFILIFLMIGAYFTYAKFLGIHAALVDDKVHRCKMDYTWKQKISIMLTCFNEGKDVYDCVMSIMASDYPTDLIEIIACDDCSPDDSYTYIIKLKELFPNNITVMRNDVNLGKPDTLLRLAKLVTGEIIFNIDSDTIIAPNAISETIACYADPEMGAVGAQIRIKNVNDSLWTQLQTIQYWYMTWFFKALENKFLTSRCLCGPMVSFRRDAYMPLQPLIEERNFLGVRAFHGEDTFITSLLVLGVCRDRPWKVFNCMSAVCWTGTPATTVTYFNQQLRWRKGTVVNGFYVMKNLLQHTLKSGMATALMTTTLTVMLLSLIFTLVHLWLSGVFLDSIALLCLAMSIEGVIRCYIYNLTIGRRDKMGQLKNPFLAGMLFGGWYIFSWIVLSFFGSFTLDNSGWITRQSHGNIR